MKRGAAAYVAGFCAVQNVEMKIGKKKRMRDEDVTFLFLPLPQWGEGNS
jgi:hypothetical protein